MNCIVNQITIFNNIGEKRTVPFSPGLNIITGNSKTGKSALIEIVDYCFCSKTSNIPRGEISTFAYCFVTVLEFPNKFIVISRKNFFQGGNNKISVKVEYNREIINDISLAYIDSMPSMYLNEGQVLIERNMNLSVTNIAQSDDVEPSKKRKAVLREMTSFLFQHQNLLASKHALFYRFDEQYKRQGTIDSFPIFAGWVNDEYFSLKRELEAKEKLLRQTELNYKKREQIILQVENEMKGYFRNYYAIIGKPFNNNLTFNQLIDLRNQLPDYTQKTYLSSEALNRFNLLKKEQEEKGAEHTLLGKQLNELRETEDYANSFQVGLKTLKIKSYVVDDKSTHFDCPTCGKANEELSNEAIKIINAKENLALELSQLGGYAISYQKEIDEIEKKRSLLKKEIIVIGGQIKQIEDLNNKIVMEKNISKNAIYAKAQLDLRLDLFLKEKNVVLENDAIKDLKSEIEILKQKLTVYSISHLYKNAEIFLSNNMNKFGEKLDFEIQLTPLKFRFDLIDFKFSHNAPDIGDITINEMGSGANWLTCHLSIFMSFLHYFASEKKSVIPSFLFFDQPSQVYFPSTFGEGKDRDNDIKQVEKVYIAILEELEEIKDNVGFTPQVIVTDHADNLDLGKYNFNDYVRRRWVPEIDVALI